MLQYIEIFSIYYIWSRYVLEIVYNAWNSNTAYIRVGYEYTSISSHLIQSDVLMWCFGGSEGQQVPCVLFQNVVDWHFHKPLCPSFWLTWMCSNTSTYRRFGKWKYKLLWTCCIYVTCLVLCECTVLSNQSLELYFVMTTHQLFRRKVIHQSFHWFFRKTLRMCVYIHM